MFPGEFGQDERGMRGKVDTATWTAAHDRRNHLHLAHWMTDTKSNSVGTSAGIKKGFMLPIPSTILEVKDCLRYFVQRTLYRKMYFQVFRNFRSVQARIWPWDWTPEAMINVLLNFDFLSRAEDRGVKFRIYLIDVWFNNITKSNSDEPSKRPLTFDDMQSRLIALLIAYGR